MLGFSFHPCADGLAARALAVGVDGRHAEPASHPALQAGQFAGLPVATDGGLLPARRRRRVRGHLDEEGAAAHGSFPAQAHPALRISDDNT